MPETIEGRNAVAEALRARRPINRLVLARNIQRHSTIAEILRLACGQGIPVEYVEETAFRRLSTTGASQSVLAFTASKDYINLDDLLTISRRKNEAPLYCILDGIEDPQNLGAILRTADATGFHGIVVRSRRAVGLTAVVAKVSAGAIEYVPVARVANISQSIELLKKNGIWTIGIDTGGKQEYTAPDYTMPVTIVIGGEGAGISELVKKRCDLLVRIPMKGKIGSLNASVAAALVMYEACRQRRR